METILPYYCERTSNVPIHRTYRTHLPINNSWSIIYVHHHTISISYTWAIILIYLKMLSYLSNVSPTLSVFYSIGKPTLLQSISFLFFGSINSFGFNLVPSVVTFEMAIISKPSRWKRTRSNFSLARIWHIYSFSIYESDWWIGMKLTFPWFGQFIRCFLILAFDQCLTQAIPLFFLFVLETDFFCGQKVKLAQFHDLALSFGPN